MPRSAWRACGMPTMPSGSPASNPKALRSACMALSTLVQRFAPPRGGLAYQTFLARQTVG